VRGNRPAGRELFRRDEEAAIRDLTNRAARLNDSGDVDEYLECWTEDLVWEKPGEIRRGRLDFRTAITGRRDAGIAGPGSHGCHLVVNQVVSFDSPTTATSEFYMVYVACDGEAPTLRSVHRNRDSLHKGSDGWRIAHRVIAAV
jgi:hypothetical protein